MELTSLQENPSPSQAGSAFAQATAAAAANPLQSCLTLCNPRDGSPPGSPVPGILQARTLEWVAISFSNAWKWKVKVKSLSRVQLFATPWTAAYQDPPSMGFSRQEYWSGVPPPNWLGKKKRLRVSFLVFNSIALLTYSLQSKVVIPMFISNRKVKIDASTKTYLSK